MIRKLASGLYSWLPLGLRVLKKVERVVREEMDRAGCQEILMPAIQPAELWEESGRWQVFGGELLRLQDRHGRDFCFGPTHEEVVTDIVRNEVSSYKQLPLALYQIQTKFRDETRPRFGVMRGREFLMKDAYSFHANEASLQETYDKMYEAYTRIFARLGLNFRAVLADTGAIGGTNSHEFHVLAESGEDAIAFSNQSEYAANVEMAEAVAPAELRGEATRALSKVETPDVKTIQQVVDFMDVPAAKVVKTLIVRAEVKEEGTAAGLVALVLRGDHELNEIKAEKLDGVASPLEMAADSDIEAALGCKPGSVGPVGVDIPVIVDRSAAQLSNFVAGANEDGFHFRGVNWERDASITRVEDIRNVQSGDPSPDGQGTLEIKRGIEVGHIFQLGTKYSEALGAKVLDENGKSVTLAMGCYGIGVSRLVASAIEQNHDENGIVWPASLAPFQVGIIPLNAHKSEDVRRISEELYQSLQNQGIEVLLDDRDKKVSPGVKFADMELMGVSHRIVVSDRSLKESMVEYKGRRDQEPQSIQVDQILDFIKGRLVN